MISSSTALSLTNIRTHTPSCSLTEPKPKPPNPNSAILQTITEPNSEPQPRKPKKVSPQLNRWSRARAIRSGKKLDYQVPRKQVSEMSSSTTRSVKSKERELVEVDDVEGNFGKSIYMVSDGTGWTAEHSVNAALGQFEHCLVDRGCPVNTHLFSGVIMSFPFFL